MNSFLKQMKTGAGTAQTWNGAISHASTGSSLLDYFAKCGSYRGRSCEEVNADMASIFARDARKAMQTVLYNRMITRKVKGLSDTTETVQRGQGQKDEFIKSLAWLENNRPEVLYDNLFLVPLVGSWKDLWYDSAATGFHYYIAPQRVYELVERGLRSEYHRGLIAKFLPKIRSAAQTTNDRHRRLNAWARGLCKHLGWSERDYRKFKASPENTAHLYQRFMSDNKWDELDFNMIPGKALLSFVSGRGKDGKNVIDRHNLTDKYLSWIKSQPVAKFNGYPYELYQKAKAVGRNLVQRYTYNAQFEKLLETARDSVNPELLRKGVFCALDTSGSMSCNYHMGGIQNVGITPIDVCVGLGIYFSSLIEGSFKNHVIMFDNTSRMKELSGTFCDKVDQINKEATAWGGTNFQSVIDEIVRVRRTNPEIPVEDYPEVLLVVSDMQFSPTAGNVNTNYQEAMRKLRSVGLPDMTIIWWQCNGQNTSDFPSTIDNPGTVLISGFDGAIVTSILGGTEEVVDEKTGEKRKKTPVEVMDDCLSQEILQKVVV